MKNKIRNKKLNIESKLNKSLDDAWVPSAKPHAENGCIFHAALKTDHVKLL